MTTPQTQDRLIIGCGNLLRGDDGLGPRLVRALWDLGLGEHVRLSDGGTAGMNVAFDMRGMREVVLVDACRTGAKPGELFEVPGDHVQTPPLDAVNLHNFRWDHALAFAKWLLKDEYPARVTVYLVEGQCYDPGADLSPPVASALARVAAILADRFLPPPSPTVELTTSGYLVFDAELTRAHLLSGNVLADVRQGELVVTPLAVGAVGGLMVK